MSRLASLWRLRSYVRPYRRQMLVALVCAAMGVGAGPVIPLVIMAIVDGPIAGGSRSSLAPMVGVILILGLLEPLLLFGRRWMQSVAVLRIELRVQTLPMTFDHLPYLIETAGKSGKAMQCD